MDDPLAPPVDPVGSDTFDMLVSKLRTVWDGDGDAGAKAKAMTKIVKTLLKLEDDLAEEPAEEPAADAEPTVTPESVQPASSEIDALKADIAKLTEQIAVLTKAVETPVTRPRSQPIRESVAGDYQPPKDTGEFVARLKQR